MLFRQPVRKIQVVRVISYYTSDAYAREILPLHASLQTFALHYQTKFVAGIDTWLDAVLFKPQFILTCLREMQADAVFFTDADSEFRRKPDWSLFDGIDVSWAQFKRGGAHVVEHLTGSMFFRNTPEVQAFVEDWAAESKKPIYRTRFTPEMDSLRITWELKADPGQPLWKTRLRYLDLPPAWVCFDDMKELHPEIVPVIVHRQASRRHRHGKDSQPKTQDAQAATPAPGSGERDADRPPPIP